MQTVWLSKSAFLFLRKRCFYQMFKYDVGSRSGEETKEIRKVLLSLTRKNYRQRISVTSMRCVWVLRTNLNGSFRLDSHNRNSYGFGLYCSPFVNYCCKVSKAYVTRSPVQSPNTNKKPSAHGLEGCHHFQREQSHRQFEVLMLSVDLCLMTCENGLTPRMLASTQLTMPTCIWKKWQPWWPPSLLKGKKFFFLCVGQPKTI